MMLSSPGRTAPRSPAKSPARRALPKYESKHNDDIDCVNWLAEIGMTQYAETFLVNLSPDGKILSRKRLGQIRQNDLPKMNIVSFVHQKLLMEHIRHVLNHEFDSPLRRKEVKELNNRHGLADEKAQEKEKHPVHYISTEAKLAEEMKHNNDEKDPLHKKVGARRRRSFDHQVWQSISNLRTKQSNIASAADSLREGIFQEAKPKPKSSHRRRRWSFGEGEKAGTTFDKAQQYGNLAQEYDMMLSNLRSLQEEYLSEVRSIVNCEVASILFLNDRTRDLMLYAGNSWYRIPCGTGIAGYCAETGENLNITDAYADFRFNR